MINGPIPVTRETIAVKILKQLQNSSDNLSGYIDRLETNLNPIMSPEPPRVEEKNEPMAEYPLLFTKIRDLIMRIEESNMRIERVLQRLEV